MQQIRLKPSNCHQRRDKVLGGFFFSFQKECLSSALVCPLDIFPSSLMACLAALYQTTDTLASFLLVRAEAFSSQPRTRRCYSLLMSDSFILSDGSFVHPLPRVPRFDLCWSITPER